MKRWVLGAPPQPPRDNDGPVERQRWNAFFPKLVDVLRRLFLDVRDTEAVAAVHETRLDALDALGLTVPVPIAKGGTAATTASAARTNLGAIGGALGATDNAIVRADGTGAATAQGSAASISDTGKLTSVDADVGFTDPNSHYGASEASAKALLEELGFVLKETTRSWVEADTVNAIYAWNVAPTFVGGIPAYARAASGTADTTLGQKTFRIPVWYRSSSVIVRVHWSPAAPVNGEVWRLRCASHAGYSAGDAVPALTNLDTSITLDTAVHTANLVYTTDVTLSTVPTEGETFAVFVLYRRASSDGADNHAGQINIVGMEIVSAVYTT